MEMLSEFAVPIFVWYVVLLIIGVVFFPFTKLFFNKFYDYGFGFSKAIGILLLSYAAFALGTAQLIPFTQAWLIVLLAIAGIINVYIYKKYPIKAKKKRLKFFIAEEVLFIASFIVWIYVRSHQPDIRGLEKFMDFGFINSALKGDTFPTQDMWLAGKSINYYYFGHVTGAVLTKLSSIPSYITYNLILAQLFAMGIVQTFSLGFTLAYNAFKKNKQLAYVAGLLSAFIVNLGGNLHTIYAFTNGYQNETPVPLWETAAKYRWSDLLNPAQILERLPNAYWYPNATRFIPFTIHEFPIYSYVVADLHGHVFDIPFVLVTIGLLYALFLNTKKITSSVKREHIAFVLFLSLLLSVHYMTNAFDAPIYILLSGIILLSAYGLGRLFIIYSALLVAGFLVFNMPFSAGFEPFATGIGFNCVSEGLTASVNSALSGTFLENKLVFEGNCQISAWWMSILLWGFFWFNFLFFAVKKLREKKAASTEALFVLTLFAFSTILVIMPEFVYAKDIYPTHFRANTLFKLGYQAFIMMGIASAFTFATYKHDLKTRGKKTLLNILYLALFVPLFTLIAIYPAFAIQSYYDTKRPQSLNGREWIRGVYGEYLGMIEYFDTHTHDQPVILEAQGDSYTDYNVVSAYTGLPTIAGWWVHEWLWRGDPSVVGDLIPDIEAIYTSTDIDETSRLLAKHNVRYVIVGANEREKYQNLDESKFEALGKAVFTSDDGSGIIFEIPIDRY